MAIDSRGTRDEATRRPTTWGTKAGRPRRLARRARRVPVAGEMQGAAFTRFKVVPVDVSLLGVCLEHSHQMQPGQIYLLDLALGDQSCRLRARALWSRIHRSLQMGDGGRIVWRTGFEFIDPSPAAQAALRHLVARKAPLGPPDDTP